MNSESNPPQADEALTQFEQQLRRHELGSGTNHRNSVLYECGYAAGAADEKKKSEQTTARWKAVGLAAAILCAVSLSFHFGSGVTDSNDRLGMSPRMQSTPQTEQTEMQSMEKAWRMHLTRERQVEVQNARILRASSSLAEAMNAPVADGQVEGGPTQSQSAPLRATDSNLLL